MAMMKCRECGEKLSNKAKTCPNCGAPNKIKSHLMSFFLVVLMSGFAFSYYTTETYYPSSSNVVSAAKSYKKGVTLDVSKVVADNRLVKYKFNGKNAVKSILKDPDSAKFGSLYLNKYADSEASWALCGYVNAKNSLGGYTGDKRFITLGTSQSTFLENNQEDRWANAWNRYCTG